MIDGFLYFPDGSKYSLADNVGVINNFTDAGPYTVTLTSNLTTTYADNTEVYLMKNGVLAESSYSVTDMRLFIDYIYLDTYEKREFSMAKHRYLIEQVQRDTFVGNNTTFKLNFNHPVKELIWVNDESGTASGSTTSFGPIRSSISCISSVDDTCYDNADATKSVGEKALPFPLLSTGASVIIVSEDFKCVECVLSPPRYRFSIECDINNYSPVSNTLSIS